MNPRAHSDDDTGTRIGGFFLGLSLTALALVPIVIAYTLKDPSKTVEITTLPLGLLLILLLLFGVVLMAKAMVGRNSRK